MSTAPIPALLGKTPEEISKMGTQLYEERHKDNLLSEHHGKYVAIDVISGEAYMAEYPEEALMKARTEAPEGVFHLIRIGSSAAVSFSATPRYART